MDEPIGVGDVRDRCGNVVAHALSEASTEPGVDYVLTVVWQEQT